MSGHSKWHSIKHKKGAADAKRGKIFTRHANLITLAARQGGADINMNPTLRLAIENAKQDNVPHANIERAIKRGTGADKDSAEIHEMTYEGYGPCGVAVLIEAMTDNKNRTYTNVRTIFGKKGGNLGGAGSVAWMFDRKGFTQVDAEGKNKEELELMAIDAGVQDLQQEENNVFLYTDPSDLIQVTEKMKSANYKVEKAEILMVPNNMVMIENEDDLKKVLDFIEALEDDPDINNVSVNFQTGIDLNA